MNKLIIEKELLKENVERIKGYLDSVLKTYQFIKPLLGKGDETIKDDVFYGELDRELLATKGVELSPNNKQKLFIEQFYLYMNLEENFISRGKIVHSSLRIFLNSGIWGNVLVF